MFWYFQPFGIHILSVLIQRLLLRLLVIIAPVGTLVVLANYFVDPAHLFSSATYLQGIGEILSKGHNVDNVGNYNERLLQELMVTRLHKTPDVVVLGSSRIMEVGSDFFPGKTVLNCGVSHANINDLIALTGLLDSLHRLPATMVINVDPSLVNRNKNIEWKSLYDYYDFYFTAAKLKKPAGKKNDPSMFFDKIYTLVSLNYFRESLNFLIHGRSGRYNDVLQNRPTSEGRFFDGTICYPSSYTRPDTVKLAIDSRNTAIRQKAFDTDPENIRLLNDLIMFLQSKQINIEWVMLPYHPVYFETTNKLQQNFFQASESFFINFARQRNIPVKGSFDARVNHISQSEFYDLYHCSKEAIKKIIVN